MTNLTKRALATSRNALITIFLTAAVVSCGSDSFKVEGTIEGADDASVILEKADYTGRWAAVDSVRTSKSGKFSMRFAAPAAPEVFRLKFGGEYVYFPVDSTETVTVNSSAVNFGHAFTLAGSEQALDLMAFEKEAMRLSAVADPDSASRFKRKVFDLYIRDRQGGLISYYVLTKTLDGKPLFDPADAQDVRYYSAVATAFRQFKPDDPRTELLEQIALAGMRRRNSEQGKQAVVEARELRLIDITLPNPENQKISLSQVAANGRPTVLVFTALGLEGSPAVNQRLNELRQSRGLDIYMVCLDGDQYSWREAARNLPWTVVYAAEGVQEKSLRDYNVTELPTFFVYDAQGELKDRAATVDELAKKL